MRLLPFVISLALLATTLSAASLPLSQVSENQQTSFNQHPHTGLSLLVEVLALDGNGKIVSIQEQSNVSFLIAPSGDSFGLAFHNFSGDPKRVVVGMDGVNLADGSHNTLTGGGYVIPAHTLLVLTRRQNVSGRSLPLVYGATNDKTGPGRLSWSIFENMAWMVPSSPPQRFPGGRISDIVVTENNSVDDNVITNPPYNAAANRAFHGTTPFPLQTESIYYDDPKMLALGGFIPGGPKDFVVVW